MIEKNPMLYYMTPAREWVEALPLGNGHMGAMVYGNGLYELTEATCWSGCRIEDPLKPEAGTAMAKARKALSEYKIAEAERLLEDCVGLRSNYGTQLPMGRLKVQLVDGTHSEKLSSRSLDLRTGMATETLSVGSAAATREAWISNPDHVMGVRVTAEAPIDKMIIGLEGWSNPSKTEYDTDQRTMVVHGIALENIHSDGLHGVRYCIQLRLMTDGEVIRARNGLRVEGATMVTVYLTSACSLFGVDECQLAAERMDAALGKSYEMLREDHRRDVREVMERSVLTLPGNENSELPTDERLQAYREDPTDHALIALFYEYGRYLLMISSREDSVLPAALQGVLNDNRACRMEWTDDMHLDVNTQMNYYPADVTGLGDMVTPLARWIRDVLMPEGETMARRLYGASGWCAHTVSNAHGWAAPGWDVSWGFFLSGGAWTAISIWEHWLYTQDRVFLEDYFPVLMGCARFYHDILTEDPETGWLVVNPSYSPENQYLTEDGQHAITVGSTVDTSMARYMFRAVLEGAEYLKLEDPFYDSIAKDLSRLPEFQIDSLGRIQEWIRPYQDAHPDHRHMSHLLSLHPLGLIDPRKTPELGRAVCRVIEERLGENARDIVLANWAGAMLVILNARLYDGAAALHYIHPMIGFFSRRNMLITHEGPTDSETGGIYELDGNTGLTAGIAEMLIQNRKERTDILPALPSEWKTGAVSGLHMYGGAICQIQWDEQTVTVRVTRGPEKTQQHMMQQHIMLVYKEQKEEITGIHNDEIVVRFRR